MTKARTTTMVDDAKRFGDEIVKLGRNTYHFGLGTMATAEEEVRGVLDRMVSKGEDIAKHEDSYVAKATGKVKEFGEMVDDGVQNTVAATLNRAGIPSRSEIRKLIRRVEELTAKVDKLATH